MTFACPGNARPRRGGSPPPASAADFGTSTPPCPAWPVDDNPASPAPDGPKGRRTAAPHPATTWEKPPEGNAHSRHAANAQVKEQAETVFPYFTDPGRYVQWMGTDARLEPVPGCCYRVIMRDGVEASGEFVEIDPPRRLVFTWGWTHDPAV